MHTLTPFAKFDPAAFHINISCVDGLESPLMTELTSFGVASCLLRTGRVRAEVSLAQFYHICLYSRVASRVLLPLGEYHFKKNVSKDGKPEILEDVAESLYQFASRFDWTSVFGLNNRFVVRLSVDKRVAVNQQFATLRVKDAIADCFNSKLGARPDVDSHAPDFTIAVQVGVDFAELTLDLTGTSLHRRGYRIANTEAPLKENLAAALLYECGWHTRAYDALIDPMCGSGTFITEALLMYADYPVGLEKAPSSFGFYAWQFHDDMLWQGLVTDAQDKFHANLERMAQKMPAVIASDASASAIHACHKNLLASALVSVADKIKLQARPLAELPKVLRELPSNAKPLIITNPPYGERLGDESLIRALYQGLGLILRDGLNHLLQAPTLAVIAAKVEDVDVLPIVEPKTLRCHNGALTVYFRHGQMARRTPPALITRYEKQAIDFEGAQDFVNRLQKNLSRLKKTANKHKVSNLRIYDADLPDFNLAIDLYGTKVHVQEYAAPKSIDATTASRRFSLALSAIRQVLGVNREDVFIKTRARQSGAEQYTRQSAQGKLSVVKEDGVYFYVNFTDYLDTGLFIDHRNMRLKVKQASMGKHVLNLFAYTCSASVHAAMNGAKSVTSVDLSSNYLAWGQLNFSLNGLVMDTRYAFVAADVFEWIKDNSAQYDVIFIDPPTFSNSKKFKGTFDVQRDHAALINRAMNRLVADGVLYFSNNYTRFVLDDSLTARYDVKLITHETIGFDFDKDQPIHQSFEIRHKQRGSQKAQTKDPANATDKRFDGRYSHSEYDKGNNQTQDRAPSSKHRQSEHGKQRDKTQGKSTQRQSKAKSSGFSKADTPKFNKAKPNAQGAKPTDNKLADNQPANNTSTKRVYVNPKLDNAKALAERLNNRLQSLDGATEATPKRYQVKKKS